MDSKVIGAMLLIATAGIGGGMLALPIITANAGFIPAVFILVLSWGLMTSAALLVVEVNSYFPGETNFVSMAKACLGTGGAIIAWACSLCLFYALLAAYLAGGADLFTRILHSLSIPMNTISGQVAFTLCFGLIVYKGIAVVDYVNRGLISLKFFTLALICVGLITHVKLTHLSHYDIHQAPTSLAIVITSFGFANVVPSLCTYLHYDSKRLRRAIIGGSLIPLICYIVWVGLVIGALPLHGHNSLSQILMAKHTTSRLTDALSLQFHSTSIHRLISVFTAICIVTSFLGIAVGLSDFIADGLQRPKRGKHNLSIYGLTFVPPLTIAASGSGIFMRGLAYAGILCLILLLLLPALMAYSGRYLKQFDKPKMLPGGKRVLLLIMLSALACIGLGS